MLISVNWLKDWVEFSETAQEIADKLSVSGLEVEHLETWESVKGGLKGFVVGQVLSCDKHPNADKLSLTTVDIGAGEILPIVCGAPNVAAGQKVIVAKVGTEVNVPGKGSFVIGEAKIRGEVSRGMICAEDEMGIGSSHDGIMVLDSSAQVGMNASEYFMVTSDEVLEIGLTANRGDAASHLGVARDVAALLSKEIKKIQTKERTIEANRFSIEFNNDSFCSNYFGLLLEGVSYRASSEWMQKRLRSIGIEPKNAIVDTTNYVLHDLGQPIHAFDADKLKGDVIKVRLAAKGEKFTTLDKLERECLGGELVIADEGGPIAFAGVMGSLDTCVTETTKNILIESAHFEPGLVRKTARAHGLSTDASFRFERGTDVNMSRTAAFYASDLMREVVGGEEKGLSQCITAVYTPRMVALNLSKLNAFAGVNIPVKNVETILSGLGFKISGTDESRQIEIPSWRNDIAIEVDIYEEIMRIYGYDLIPMSGKMTASLAGFSGTELRKAEDKVRQMLVSKGCFEIENNSLGNKTWYSEEEQTQLVKISNPLSADMEIMRGSLLPGMLQAVSYNLNRQMENLRFFEFGRVYSQNGNGFVEQNKLGILICGNRTEESWEKKAEKTDIYDLKTLVTHVIQALKSDTPTSEIQLTAVSKSMLKKFDIAEDVWFAELNWEDILGNNTAKELKIIPSPKFPIMRRDLSLVLEKGVPFSEIEKIVTSMQITILRSMKVFDVFEGKPLEEGKKAIAIAFYLGQTERTLTDDEAEKTMNALIMAFEKNIGAIIRR
jgi:phenylalanyl-tRNA synthetase beta chain